MTMTSYMQGLKCRECGKRYETKPLFVCEFCFGPLEVDYDYEAIRRDISRELISSRGPSMWRYRELLPLAGEVTAGADVGFTPFTKADRLAKALGVEDVYIKNDAVNYPTLSFKDRVVSVAISRSLEFGFKTVGCATTGNLGNSVAAHAVQAGLECYIFCPAGIEQSKILGTSIFGVNVIGIRGNYDSVNRLCAEIAGKYGWAFANVNIRPYYAEGSKSFAFEIAEQFGWRVPDHIVVPMAGGSLITKIGRAFKELHTVGLLDEPPHTKIHGAQASGCAPITTAVKNGTDVIKPVKPDTIAHSIAIGDPADGYYACQTITGSGGWAEDVSDDELIAGIRLLAETEGIFTETAGGVTVAVTKKLIEQGRIPPDESIVISITGNGLKTQEAVAGVLPAPTVIGGNIKEFDVLMEIAGKAAQPAPAAQT